MLYLNLDLDHLLTVTFESHPQTIQSCPPFHHRLRYIAPRCVRLLDEKPEKPLLERHQSAVQFSSVEHCYQSARGH